VDPVLIFLVIVALVGWAVLHHHPLKVCPKCSGTGRVYSTWFPTRYRPCPRCNRDKEVRGALGRRT
jgi:hypothetical protein